MNEELERKPGKKSENKPEATFRSIQDFRNRATKQDMKALEDYILSQRKKSEAFPNSTYGFSYSSASKYLRENGFLSRLQTPEMKEEKPEFLIRGIDLKEDPEYVSRTFCVRKDLLDRYDQFCAANRQYPKKAIINKLLDEVLSRYGF